MVINSIRALSLGKILGSIYASLGLIFGLIVALASLAGLSPVAGDESAPAFIGVLLGGGAVIALPIFYGLLGFIGGLLVGAIYNFVARIVGGLEIEVT